MASSALRFKTALLAMATTYSTPASASRNASSWGFAKPPSRRTRMRTFENELRITDINRRQNPHRSRGRGNIAGTQHGGAQILISLVVEGNKAHHRQVTRVVIVAIEERQLLRAMRGIVGRIKIDGDQPGVMV